jgi:glycosyltransferase involved in cell wall biosynthesis
VTQAPEVSCVIPSYQSVPLLSRALVSIATQADVRVEIIVSDDSADPRVKAHVEAMASVFDMVRYRPGPRSGNPVDNWNAGLDAARGACSVLVHHDEFLCDPGRLRRTVDLMTASGAGVCIAGHHRAGGDREGFFPMAARLAAATGFRPWTLYLMNWIGPTAAVAFRTDLVPRFDPALVWLVDVDFYCRLLETGVRVVRDTGPPGVVSLQHPDQITRRIEPRLLRLRELQQLEATRPGFPRGWRYWAALATAAARVPPWLWQGRDAAGDPGRAL